VTGLRALLRLAVRDACRDRRRSALVVALVALLVAGLVAAATLSDSGSATAEENATSALGRADVVFRAGPPTLGGPSDDAEALALLDRLPAGSRTELVRRSTATLGVDGVRVPVQVSDGSLAPDALGVGRLDVVDGQAPLARDAVALSTAVLERARVRLGDRVTFPELGAVTVTGEVRDPSWLSRPVVVVPAGALEGADDADLDVLVELPVGVTLPDLGPAVVVDDAVGTGDEAFVATTRDAMLAERFGRAERFFFVVAGGLAVVEVALVAGAAFAVSVRRRQRELGLLAATGGTVAHVRSSVLLSGVTIGLVGAAAGAAVGLLGSWLALPLLSRVVDRTVDALRVDPAWVLGAVTVGAAAAIVGAWWPARSVARLPVLTALSGRRPTPAPARSGLAKGLALVVVGAVVCLVGSISELATGLPYVFLVGAVLVVLGAGLTSPWLLEQSGRTARHLPAGARLAVRDAARFRTRNGPIVTAAMAGLAASVTVAAVVGSVAAADARSYVPDLPPELIAVSPGGLDGAGAAVATAVGSEPTTVRRLQAATVAAGTVELLANGDQSATYVDAALVDADLARLVGGDAAVSDLAAGRAVAVGATDLDGVEVRPFHEVTGELSGAAATYEVVAHPPRDPGRSTRYSGLPEVLLPDDAVTARWADTDTAWSDTFLLHDGPVDDEQLRAAAAAARNVGDEVTVTAERGYQAPYRNVATSVTVAGGLAGLAIAGIAIALAAAEARPDLRTLTAVGAGRRTRRGLVAGRALLLSGLGGLLAVPVGLVPAAALLTAVDGIPLVLPWSTIATVAVVVPALATLGAVVAATREPAGLSRAA
jgi:putative ABC transport system permease protein